MSIRHRIHTSQIWVRIAGSLSGAAFLAMGAFSLLGGENLDEQSSERAMGFGIAALIAGIWAIGVSWLDRDLSGIWCRPPRRWSARRDDTRK